MPAPPFSISHLGGSPLFSISVFPNGGVLYICGSLGRKLGAQLGGLPRNPKTASVGMLPAAVIKCLVPCGAAELQLSPAILYFGSLG